MLSKNQNFLRPLSRYFCTAGLLHTPLNSFHVEKGGKMVDFCGWSLPVSYSDQTVMESHLHTRTKASIFDVSHMRQLHVTGLDGVAALERLVVGDLQSLQPQEGRLSLLTNERGGIIDDLIITAQNAYLNVVVNAGCASKDIKHIQENFEKFRSEGLDVDLKVLEGQGLIALQGPEAMAVLQQHVSADLTKMPFMTASSQTINGATVTYTRCGYTGEDGFELSMAPQDAEKVVRTLLDSSEGRVKMAGLGARDSLRLEAGLCLYGHDINEDISPVEAGLLWTIGKRRRAEGGFPGFEVISKHIEDGVTKKRVGFTVAKPPTPREGAVLQSKDGAELGLVTSGTFSPWLQKPIGMGYVPKELSKAGTEICIDVRGRKSEAVVTKMPFVPANYFKVVV
eukprot:Platyproteum_vivax@DN15928_c0_g1_i1.p1